MQSVDWKNQKYIIDPAFEYQEFFGASTDSVGDVNGDGWSDFVIAGGDYALPGNYFEIYLIHNIHYI